MDQPGVSHYCWKQSHAFLRTPVSPIRRPQGREPLPTVWNRTGWTEREEARAHGGWDDTRARWLGKIPRLEGEAIAETLRLINTVGCWAAEQFLFYCIRKRTGELRVETDGMGGIHTPPNDLLHEPRKFLPNHWPPFYLLLEIGN